MLGLSDIEKYIGNKTLSDKHGLWIGGERIENTLGNFQSVLKYALVAPELQSREAFASDDISCVLGLVGDIDVEIATAMVVDTALHEFDDPGALFDNIALRKGVINAMRAICAGEIDADYVEATVGVPPTLGYLRNLEVLFTPGAQSGKGVLTQQAPFNALSASWDHVPDTRSWSGFTFMQKTGVALSKALQDITPFRGECAGALELAVLLGCLNGNGAEKLDALADCYGPAFIGAWSMDGIKAKSKVQTLARRFLSDVHDVPQEYARGSIIAVPGDYLYFQNKNDYPNRAPGGGWRGENCIYMGQDWLGGPHYSGLGLGWKTEFALRMFLGNAYFTDANGAYLNELRSKGHSDIIPAIVEDPIQQVRFTARAIMRCPEPSSGPAPEMRLPDGQAPKFDEAAIRAQIDSLGFEAHGADTYELARIKLHRLMDALDVGDHQLRQAPSVGLTGAALSVSLGPWTFRIEPLDPVIRHLSTDDIVRVHARYEP